MSLEIERPRRFCGHRKDPGGLPRHVGAPPQFVGSATPSSATIPVAGVWDQSITSTCVGHAIAQAIEMRMIRIGTPVPHLSPYCIVDFARRIEFRGAPMLDVGCVPALAMQGITQWGVCAYETRPSDPGAVNDPPKLAELEDAATFELVGYTRIDSTGAERVQAIRAALAAGYPVTHAILADDAFEAYQNGVMGAPNPEAIKGGHYICAIGYRTSKDGSTFVRSVNSWGAAWGAGGFVEFSEEAIAAWEDIYVMNVRRVAS